MRVACVSDLHENLVPIPECDLLLVAGGITFGLHNDLIGQQRFLCGPFKEWLDEIPADEVVVVAGNHDQNIEAWGWPHEAGLRCHYLQDSGIELCGQRIWGTPWQPYFYDWAFNSPQRDPEGFLKEKFDRIPDETDIVVCHGPPYGYGDQVGNPSERDRSQQPRVGSRAMTDALRRVQPSLMVCGHIHSGAGKYRLHGTQTTVINAAVVDNRYRVVREPVVVDL